MALAIPFCENAILQNCESIRQKLRGLIVLKKVHFLAVHMTFSVKLCLRMVWNKLKFVMNVIRDS
jgi:hypothetical protein